MGMHTCTMPLLRLVHTRIFLTLSQETKREKRCAAVVVVVVFFHKILYGTRILKMTNS